MSQPIVRAMWVVPVFALLLSGCNQTPQQAEDTHGQSDFVDPGENWKHPIAGRSPFPAPDEVSLPAKPRRLDSADHSSTKEDRPSTDGFFDPGRNAKHPIARRSAFPEPGEEFDKPIPAKLLVRGKEVDPDEIPEVVPWNKASQYLGYEITVEGRIEHLGKSGKVNFLNFDKDWQGKFYVVIFDDLAATLDARVEETFKGKLIRVKGIVENFRGKPQIKISSMDQVEFVKE